MSLPDFIEANLDALVDDWADFAGQLMCKGQPLTTRELQDSVRHMLQKICGRYAHGSEHCRAGGEIAR
jgi:hypothetical protein